MYSTISLPSLMYSGTDCGLATACVSLCTVWKRNLVCARRFGGVMSLPTVWTTLTKSTVNCRIEIHVSLEARLVRVDARAQTKFLNRHRFLSFSWLLVYRKQKIKSSTLTSFNSSMSDTFMSLHVCTILVRVRGLVICERELLIAEACSQRLVFHNLLLHHFCREVDVVHKGSKLFRVAHIPAQFVRTTTLECTLITHDSDATHNFLLHA